MNAAQHAGQILRAWEFGDVSNFEMALSNAFSACTSSRALSHLESERAEVLQGIVEHLRAANREGKLPEYSGVSAAWALLSHLSCKPKEESETNRDIFSTKTLNFGMERAKCFVEVECRPRAYAG